MAGEARKTRAANSIVIVSGEIPAREVGLSILDLVGRVANLQQALWRLCIMHFLVASPYRAAWSVVFTPLKYDDVDLQHIVIEGVDSKRNAIVVISPAPRATIKTTPRLVELLCLLDSGPAVDPDVAQEQEWFDALIAASGFDKPVPNDIEFDGLIYMRACLARISLR